MESIIAAVVTTTVGLLCGQTVFNRIKKQAGNRISRSAAWESQTELRLEQVEKALPTFIPRNEVAEALNKVPPIVMQAVQQEMRSIQQPVIPRNNPLNNPPQLTAEQLQSLQAHEQSMKAMQEAAALLDKFEQQEPIKYQRPFPTEEQK